MSQRVKYNGKTYDRRHLAAIAMAKDMLEDTDEIKRRFAATTLMQLGQAEALVHVTDFLAALKDVDAGVRYWAIVYLSGAKNFSGPSPVAEHTEELVPMLQDEDPGIRYWTIEALGAQGFASIPQLNDLLKMIEDSDPHCRIAAAKAVARVGPDLCDQVAEILCQSLEAEEPFFRISGIEGLGYLQEAGLQYTEQLCKALNDKHAPVRVAAAEALAMLGKDAVAEAAARLAKAQCSDPDKDVREAVGTALKLLDYSGALEDEDVDLRRYAAEMVSKSGLSAADHAEVLETMLLAEEDEAIRGFVAEAFSNMGPKAAEFSVTLKMALQDTNPDVWPPVVRALARHAPEDIPEVLDTVAEFLASEDPNCRTRAVDAIGAARDAAMKHLDRIVPLMEDEEVQVRLAVIKALISVGQRGVRKGDKALAKAVKEDPDSQVRRESLNILRHFFLAGKFGLDDL